jgi:bifunctional DNA-binding transcriptional regulator/antitoxin component of YhaV-PrlF toxin-antitoxin module
MEKLDALYETLGWNHTDPLTFVIEGDTIVIRNLFQEQRDREITTTDNHPYE